VNALLCINIFELYVSASVLYYL